MKLARTAHSIGDILSGLILFLIGLIWAIGAESYGLLGEGGRIAPGTVPFACGTALAFTGMVITIQASRSSSRQKGGGSELDQPGNAAAAGTRVENASSVTAKGTVATLTDDKPKLSMRMRTWMSRNSVFTVFAVLTAGLLLMPILGFFISFGLLIFVILRYVEQQSIRISVFVGAITAFLGFILFEVFFNLPLPEPFFV